MIKNDITYEYRVFTNRLIDVEAMEVGKCTSKVVKELKAKDKVDGRFFHTSDTDEWFFCWTGELQKLNLKGDADVNNALAEVRELINEAEKAVKDAKDTASEAAKAAADAQKAADAAGDAVESIENKADVSYVDTLVAQEVAVKADKTAVDALTTTVAGKADASVVDALDAKVDSKADKSELDSKATIDSVNSLTELVATKADSADVKELSDKVDAIKLDDYALKSEVPSIKGLATEEFVEGKIAGIEIPTKVSDLENDEKYLTKDVADGYYAAIGTTGSGNGVDKNYVDTELAKKQNVIDDIDDIRSKANSALQSIPDTYVTDEELEGKGYLTEHQDISGKQDVIENLDEIIAGAAKGATSIQSLDGYATEEFVTGQGYATVSQVEGKQDKIEDLDAIRTKVDNAITAETLNESLNNYYTKGEIDGKIDAINTMFNTAIEMTNTILGE